MFNIIKRNKPIIVDCYTNNYSVYNFAQIQDSKKFIPNWFKELNSNEKNLKGCPGFIELYKKSFIYPMWQDLHFFSYESSDINEEPQLFQESATDKQILVSHDSQQYNKSFRPGFKHVKFISPWFIKTKEDLDWVVVPAFWNHEQKNQSIFFPPAIDNYKNQHSTTWQAFIKTDGTDIIFKVGDPLVQLIPKTDRKIKLRCHYDPDTVKKLDDLTASIHFLKSYYKRKKIT